MIGGISSLDRGPERTVKLIVGDEDLYSEISEPAGHFDPKQIQSYELQQTMQGDQTLYLLHFVLSTGARVCFYSTWSTFDLALLLDQLDGTIGARPRKHL